MGKLRDIFKAFAATLIVISGVWSATAHGQEFAPQRRGAIEMQENATDGSVRARGRFVEEERQFRAVERAGDPLRDDLARVEQKMRDREQRAEETPEERQERLRKGREEIIGNRERGLEDIERSMREEMEKNPQMYFQRDHTYVAPVLNGAPLPPAKIQEKSPQFDYETRKKVRFTALLSSAIYIFNGMKRIIYAACALGIIAVALSAIFGRMNWKYLATIIIGIVAIAGGGSLMVYLMKDTGAVVQVSGITDTLRE